MRAHGLRARGKKKFKVKTDSAHGLPVSPNLLERKFDVEAPNRFWSGDITYIWPWSSIYSAVGWLAFR
jgi:putative transposase